jgi:Domain of unknown function (DUF4158)
MGRGELVRYFTLTTEDLEWINSSARGTPTKLGLAVQLGVPVGGADDPSGRGGVDAGGRLRAG